MKFLVIFILLLSCLRSNAQEENDNSFPPRQIDTIYSLKNNPNIKKWIRLKYKINDESLVLLFPRKVFQKKAIQHYHYLKRISFRNEPKAFKKALELIPENEIAIIDDEYIKNAYGTYLKEEDNRRIREADEVIEILYALLIDGKVLIRKEDKIIPKYFLSHVKTSPVKKKDSISKHLYSSKLRLEVPGNPCFYLLTKESCFYCRKIDTIMYGIYGKEHSA